MKEKIARHLHLPNARIPQTHEVPHPFDVKKQPFDVAHPFDPKRARR